MAETIALAASIIAIGQAAQSSFKLAESLYGAARRIQAAKDDISTFALKVTNFATAIDAVHLSLKHHTSGNDSGSPVLRFIAQHDTLGRLATQSERVTGKIRRLKRGVVRGLEGEVGLWVRLKWVVQKREIEALDPEMESVKSSLQLVLTVVVLEVLLAGSRKEGVKGKETEEVEKEKRYKEDIKSLRRQLNTHMQAIEFLQDLLESQESVTGQFLSEMRGTQSTLMELGEGMMSHGTFDQSGEALLRAHLLESQSVQESEEVLLGQAYYN